MVPDFFDQSSFYYQLINQTNRSFRLLNQSNRSIQRKNQLKARVDRPIVRITDTDQSKTISKEQKKAKIQLPNNKTYSKIQINNKSTSTIPNSTSNSNVTRYKSVSRLSIEIRRKSSTPSCGGIRKLSIQSSHDSKSLSQSDCFFGLFGPIKLKNFKKSANPWIRLKTSMGVWHSKYKKSKK
eukprot:TCONS_00061706-protein